MVSNYVEEFQTCSKQPILSYLIFKKQPIISLLYEI